MELDGAGAVAVQPIGVVRSPVAEGVDEDWGSIVAEVHLREEYAPGLRGLEQFSHVIVVFLMHRATFSPGDDLVRRPRGRADMPELGIFAQRAKHRPNPIGLTAVRLLSVRGNVLTVQGLDAIDGSPVLDIKPYFPAFDRVDDATTPEWVGKLMQGYF
ncbi:MAG TPA: tRNA (N6-threonylcarbamoyladenosine(37)-N6)-methyltransferase TrmO [Chloroflexia bacterium]|nr:tRNA (N6-threonylcarbamoyladenosine(37)-N6)-methyltransferase TrmO [Chloroflexia bacterium]